MPKRSPVPDRVALDDLTDLASAVPHMLGFYPTDSLVAIALRGPRERLTFSMRLDLLEPEHDRDVARMTAARMAHAGADSVLVFVYTAAPPAGDPLPRRRLVDAIDEELGVPVREAMLVDDGKVWSYLCNDPRCCPPDGRVMCPDSPGALALAAAYALHGNAVLADREALVATTRAIGGVAAASMRQALARNALVTRSNDGDVLEDLCEEIVEAPSALSHDDAAALALRLHDVTFRDRVISRLAAGDDTLERLVADVARLAQPPYDAPVAAVLAMAAYFRGDGVVAMAAAERALDTDATYSLARLVADCLERQVQPSDIRHVWLGADLP
jgi:hypothetical protein